MDDNLRECWEVRGYASWMQTGISDKRDTKQNIETLPMTENRKTFPKTKNEEKMSSLESGNRSNGLSTNNQPEGSSDGNELEETKKLVPSRFSRSCNLMSSKKEVNVVYQEPKAAIQEEIRIVLLGKTGSGKSATGNLLLGKPEFESTLSAMSITSTCQVGRAIRFGFDLKVVDTPGFYDTSRSMEIVTTEVLNCLQLSEPGPHVFLLVFSATRSTPEETDAVLQTIKIFGDSMSNYVLPILVRKDEIIAEGKTVEEFMAGSPIKTVLDQNAKHALHAVNNKENIDAQAKGLIFRINTIIQENIKQSKSKRGYFQEMSGLYIQAQTIIELQEENQKYQKERNKLEDQLKTLTTKVDQMKTEKEKLRQQKDASDALTLDLRGENLRIQKINEGIKNAFIKLHTKKERENQRVKILESTQDDFGKALNTALEKKTAPEKKEKACVIL